MTEVTVVSVVYNAAGIVDGFLQSLSGNKYIKQIIIIDNESKDSTCEKVKSCGLSNVNLLHSGGNVGFGNGCNVGLAAADTPYVLMLNPDAELDEKCLGELLNVAKKYPDAGIVAPRILLHDGEDQASYKRNVFDREKSGGNLIAPEGEICADFLSGAVMLWNMGVMRKVGVFDPQIFLFYEDDDICLRVRKAGYGLVFTPFAVARHAMGGSTEASAVVDSLKQYHLSWSRLYLQQKYFGRKSALKLARLRLMLFFLKCVGYSVSGRWEKSRRYKARMGGVKDFLRGSYGR